MLSFLKFFLKVSSNISLYFFSLIISTEHGPYGGDEINKIVFNKNYGWPIYSHGEDYGYNLDKKDKYKYKKDISDLNYEHPIYSFVPSIGIS